MSKHNCPSCQRGVFNRRLATCEFCGAPLPLEFLQSVEELERSEDRVDENAERGRLQRSVERGARRISRGR